MFPEMLIGAGDPVPLLVHQAIRVETDQEKANRVWNGFQQKASPIAVKSVMYAWLTEEDESVSLAFRYLCKVFKGVSETNFTDPDVLALRQMAQRVSHERERMLQFVRFQKTVDGIYFAGVSPIYNVIPLVLAHFADRFADQPWIIYDLNRGHGFYYDLQSIREIDFFRPVDPETGRLAETELAEDEKILQEAWKRYFKSVSITERANPKLQRQFMPKRFWPFLTELQ